MPDWGLQGNGLIVLVAFIAAAILICVLPALVAGKWDGWLLLLSGLVGLGFAGWGYYEYQWFGAIVGGLAGASVAYLLLGVPFGVLGALAGAKGDERNRQGEAIENVKFSTRVLLFLGRVVGVILLAGACHELYWGVNISSSVAGMQFAEELCRISALEEPPEQTAAELQTMSSRVRAFQVKPFGWILQPEELQQAGVAIELANYVSGRHVAKSEPMQWPAWLIVDEAVALPEGDPADASRESLFSAGAQLGQVLNAQANERYGRTILLRFCPRKPFAPHPVSEPGDEPPAL